jgi:hypothetical protein
MFLASGRLHSVIVWQSEIVPAKVLISREIRCLEKHCSRGQLHSIFLLAESTGSRRQTGGCGLFWTASLPADICAVQACWKRAQHQIVAERGGKMRTGHRATLPGLGVRSAGRGVPYVRRKQIKTWQERQPELSAVLFLVDCEQQTYVSQARLAFLLQR